MSNRIKKSGVVGTGCDTHTTANTFAEEHHYDAIFWSPDSSLNGANLNAGWRITLVAKSSQKHIADIRERSLLNSFDP
jgi:hypothetical protein